MSKIPDALDGGTTTLSTASSAIITNPFPDCEEVILQSDPDNTVDIFVGPASSQPIQLTPGQPFSITINQPALLYGKAASGSPTVNWLVRRRSA